MSTSRAAMVCAIAFELAAAMPAVGVTFNVADGDSAGLVSAILQSNGNIYADTINLAPGGTYTFSSSDVNADGPCALPSITSTITINGNGAVLQRDTSAGTSFRLLRINLSGKLTVNDVTVSDFESNGNGGGAFWVDGGRLTLSRCTLMDNTAFNADGGAVNSKNGKLTFTNCTLSGNHADADGGAVYCRDVGGRVTLSAVTLSDNSANGTGGGVCIDNNATLNMSDTILANSANGDCAMPAGVLNDLGYNLVEDGSCLADATSFAADPMLGPLQDNGGMTMTHALPSNSPAVDVIPTPNCATPSDQRGADRPRGAGCDIGAYEADPPPGITINSVADVESSGALQFELTLSAAADHDVLVDFATFDGTATLADNDYVATSGTMTFAAGSTSETLTVPVNDDALEEGDETLTVMLGNPVGAVLAIDTAVGTILNDDAAPQPQCRSGAVFDADADCQATVTADDLLANNLSADARCAPLTLQLTPAGPFDVGDHTVTLTATDACGQTNSCQTTFTVLDTQPPVFDCPAGPVDAANSSNSLALQALDNCDAAPLVTCSPATLDDLPPGNDDVEVVCVATDASGNTATCSYVLRRTSGFDLHGAFQDLKSRIARLRQDGDLPRLQAWTLTRSLDMAETRFMSGDTVAGCNKMNAFDNKVNALVNSRTLTDDQAEPLRAGSSVIVDHLCNDDGTDGGDNSDNTNGNDNSDGGDSGPTPPVGPGQDCGATDAAALGLLPLMIAPWRRLRQKKSRSGCKKR